MKPCSKHRRQIVLLVVEALDAQDAAALRNHLTICAGCRCYRDEIAAVSRTLSSATRSSDIEPSASFYYRLSSKLQRVEPKSPLANFFSQISTSVWKLRLAVPACVLFIVVAVMLALKHLPASSTSASATGHESSQVHSESDPPPTIASYQIAANQSLEKFSDLLRREGEKPLPPVPVYRISSFELANEPF